MLDLLDTTLGNVLDDAGAPAALSAAAKEFRTPERGYAPGRATVNLFAHEAAAREDAAAEAALGRHHEVRVSWEIHDGTGWRALDPEAGEVVDATRGLTLDGPVRLVPPVRPPAVGLGRGPALSWVRCRLAAGRPDAAPMVLAIHVNAVPAEQLTPARGSLRLAPGIVPPGPGPAGPLGLRLAADGRVVGLAPGAPGDPAPLVLDPGTAGAVTLAVTLAVLGPARGVPGERVRLPGPLADGRVDLWTAPANAAPRPWRQVADLDASGRHDHHFAVDATRAELVLGDGARGRTAPAGAWLLASFDLTAGAAGNVEGRSSWRLAGADDELNRALLAEEPGVVAAALAALENPDAAAGGRAEEDVDSAAGRAAEELWAHERLVELAGDLPGATLDGRPPASVMARRRPWRGATGPDLERLALEVPGARVRRARAWTGLDSRHPGLAAPGTVTVMIVPELPRGRPAPTSGLAAAVERYLDRRRVLGTRVVASGPHYVEVAVRAVVRAMPRVDPAALAADVRRAIAGFLDPLEGGPAGRGWPFGRDVYRSEVLGVIDGVAGVDHVTGLTLVAGEGDRCANVCVPPTALVALVGNDVEVEP